jgi:hypothetical protein
MHQSSYQAMSDIVNRLPLPENAKILDVGSYNVNGTYKPIFSKFNYTGTDQVDGPNVDIVMDAYLLKNPVTNCLIENEYDLVISGQSLEHMEFPLLAAMAMKRAVKISGWVIWIVPFACPDHKYPIDCWRVISDGMRFLLEGFENIEIIAKEHDPGSWAADTIGIGQKPANYRERWCIIDTLTRKKYGI